MISSKILLNQKVSKTARMVCLLCGLFFAHDSVVFAQTKEPKTVLETGKPIQPDAANITGILIVSRVEDVNPVGVVGIKGVIIKGPEFLQGADFKKMMTNYLNKPLTQASLDQLQVETIKYCRSLGHLVVDVFYREQDVIEGTIQIAVVEGKIGEIMVENKGKKWFSDHLIRSNVRLKSGDVVDENKLNSDLSWLNRNTYQSLGYFDGSFREVKAGFQQGNLGETDLKLTVNDRLPLRGFAGYEDSGFKVIGEDRVFAGLSWANAFGLDHRVNYQYTTDTDFDKFHAHSGSYTIPFPWRHELTLFGAYAEVDPDYAVLSPSLAGFNSKGNIYQLSGRYSVPLPGQRNFNQEITVGFDFKSTDTPLLFQTSGLNLLKTNEIEIAQFTLDYRGLLRDPWGRTTFLLQGVYSPGDLTDKNNTAAFNEFSPGTTARYVYAKAEVRRETELPKGSSWFIRALGQFADSELAPSETFGIGGYATVRGYNERTVVGDHGLLVVNELRTPWMNLGNITRRMNASDRLQGLIFCDYGKVTTKNPKTGAGERVNETLLSVGAGLRYQIADNLRFRVDYGYQLERGYLSAPGNLENQERGRVHIGAEISF